MREPLSLKRVPTCKERVFLFFQNCASRLVGMTVLSSEKTKSNLAVQERIHIVESQRCSEASHSRYSYQGHH